MNVSLVIPCRDEEAVIGFCLNSVAPLLGRGGLQEIIVVDDGSVDGTAGVVDRYPVEYIRGGGKGPGAARNLGWKKAGGDVVWFLDADCVAGPDSLPALLHHLDDPRVAGVGGSFLNACPQSRLSRLIHEEIMVRHRGMKGEADHLATGHVVFRREVLESLGGFDERFITAEDAELSYRMHHLGYTLIFEGESRVKHHYPTGLFPYFKAQFKHAYWRTLLYYRYRGKAKGDSYSGFIDFVQPFVAILFFLLIPFLKPAFGALGLLMVLQIPMALKIHARNRQLAPVFLPLGFLRAFIHGFGLVFGVLSLVRRWFAACFSSNPKNISSGNSGKPK